MHRREFLKSTGLAVATVTTAGTSAASASEGTLAAPAVLSDTKALTLGFASPDAASGPADAAHRLALAITTATGGRYRFSIKSACTRADADVYFGSPLDHVSANRTFAYFGGLPAGLGLSPTQLPLWLASGGTEHWDALAASLGFKPLLAGHTGNAPILWSMAPISDISDIEGRAIYTAGLSRDVVTGLGAKPSDLMLGAVKGSLAAGQLFAAECGGAVASFGLGLPGVARCWSPSPFQQNGTALALEVQQTVWAAMSLSDQAALKGAAAEAYQLAVAEEGAHRAALMAAFTAQTGVQRSAPSATLREAVIRVAMAVVAHAAGETRAQSRIDAAYMGFKAATSGVVSDDRPAV